MQLITFDEDYILERHFIGSRTGIVVLGTHERLASFDILEDRLRVPLKTHHGTILLYFRRLLIGPPNAKRPMLNLLASLGSIIATNSRWD